MSMRIAIDQDAIVAFCRRWAVNRLELFGSVLRDDFRPDSDIDVLVAFAPGGEMTFEGFIDMTDELSTLFNGHPVDLVEKRFVRNPFRRHEILTTRQVLYAA